jgi:hypothetical protein
MHIYPHIIIVNPKINGNPPINGSILFIKNIPGSSITANPNIIKLHNIIAVLFI